MNLASLRILGVFSTNSKNLSISVCCFQPGLIAPPLSLGFLDHFNIADGKKLLLVTSCIYVPFQYLKFMGLAINGGFDVDCIGSDVVDSGSLSKPSNYLQEIKGTIDAIYGLYHQFESDNK